MRVVTTTTTTTSSSYQQHPDNNNGAAGIAHDKTVAEERAEQRALVKREHEAANINGASAPASRHEHSASTQRRVLN